MKRKAFFNYRLLFWMLLIIALIMGGGYLVIAYSYNLQKNTERRIDEARQSVNVAKEMEMELVRLRGFTFTYLVDPTPQWLDSIKTRETRFIIFLERARLNSNTPEEISLIQQISALFSNYEQSIINASARVRRRQYSQANALLIFAAKDLLSTIHEKSRSFIALNIQAEENYELEIANANKIILHTMISLGFGGILAGLLLGWIISRMVLNPINQLILQVRGASGGAFLEKLEVPEHGDLEELGNRIRTLIERINKTQEALEKNKELLQYSNKYAVLGKVAPTLAHEIRNPLAAIKMLIYSMKDVEGFPDSLIQDLEIISSEVDRMEGFIKNFLKFARPADPVFVDTDPVEVLQEVIQLLKPKFKTNEITLTDNTATARFRVSADAGHLKQLFMNLLINAIEAMPDGGEMTLNTSLHDGPEVPDGNSGRKYLALSIEDSGPGLPEKVINHLFEPFIKGNDQGVGLGLSISQNIASIHKGWIEGKNNPEGAGAIFHIFLPLVSEE
jgi:two-component system, NtrC family, sensor histidine kinase HydH